MSLGHPVPMGYKNEYLVLHVSVELHQQSQYCENL
jgi:hypothetical protein